MADTKGYNKENACQVCQTSVGSLETKTLICKQYKKNYCIKCFKKDEVENVILQKWDTNIMWFCPYCKESVEKSIAMEHMIEEKCHLITQLFELWMQVVESELDNQCDEKSCWNQLIHIQPQPVLTLICLLILRLTDGANCFKIGRIVVGVRGCQVWLWQWQIAYMPQRSGRRAPEQNFA